MRFIEEFFRVVNQMLGMECFKAIGSNTVDFMNGVIIDKISYETYRDLTVQIDAEVEGDMIGIYTGRMMIPTFGSVMRMISAIVTKSNRIRNRVREAFEQIFGFRCGQIYLSVMYQVGKGKPKFIIRGINKMTYVEFILDEAGMRLSRYGLIGNARFMNKSGRHDTIRDVISSIIAMCEIDNDWQDKKV